MIGFGQQTYVPDDNFENYLENNGMGNNILNDDSVLTANISSITFLDISYQVIVDFTGLESFVLLDSLNCANNNASSLDVSQNLLLTYLNCSNNNLVNIDVNDDLNILMCSYLMWL